MSCDNEYSTIGEFGQVIMGLSPKGDTYNENGEGLPLLNGPTEFGSSHPLPTLYTTDSKRESKKGDLIFCVRGSTTGRMNWSDQKYSLGRGVCAIRGKSDIDTKYLRYALEVGLDSLLNVAGGGTFPNLKKDDIKTFRIPVLRNKDELVRIISAYDDLIQNNLKRIALLEQAGQNIYEEWFVNMRFPGHDKIAVDKETGLPKGWKQKELGEIISKIESGSRPKGGIDKSLKLGVPSIGAESIRGLGYFDFTKTKYVKRDFFLQMNKGHLKHKDILIYKDGAYIGRSTLFQDNFPFKECSINEHVFLVHASNEQLQYYLYFTLHSKVYFEKMQNLNSNAAQPGINQSKIKTLTIRIPTEELFVQFDKLVSPFVEQIYVLAKENLRLQQARDILLPRLMNQTIKV